MENLIATFSDYYNRRDFIQFQNNFARDVYKSLGNSYSTFENEVQTVTDMCNTINGQSFEKLKFYSKKIHGTQSIVDFYNQNNTASTELADMVIISVATKGKKIVYEKTGFIQNKKESPNSKKDNTNSKNESTNSKRNSSNISWHIDQDQLYLLQNFPTFIGTTGIIRNNFNGEVVFKNYSKTLGNYGLFQSPGEMILVNALTVYKLQQGHKISLSDIRRFAKSELSNDSFNFRFVDFRYLEEYFYQLSRHSMIFPGSFFNMPFLNNSFVSYNVYEFIRNWSLFNIGEVVSPSQNLVNSDLTTFNRIVLRAAGLSNIINLGDNEGGLESNLIVLVAHLNLDEKSRR